MIEGPRGRAASTPPSERDGAKTLRPVPTTASPPRNQGQLVQNALAATRIRCGARHFDLPSLSLLAPREGMKRCSPIRAHLPSRAHLDMSATWIVPSASTRCSAAERALQSHAGATDHLRNHAPRQRRVASCDRWRHSRCLNRRYAIDSVADSGPRVAIASLECG